jgi:hypothetical protein
MDQENNQWQMPLRIWGKEPIYTVGEAIIEIILEVPQ